VVFHPLNTENSSSATLIIRSAFPKILYTVTNCTPFTRTNATSDHHTLIKHDSTLRYHASKFVIAEWEPPVRLPAREKFQGMLGARRRGPFKTNSDTSFLLSKRKVVPRRTPHR